MDFSGSAWFELLNQYAYVIVFLGAVFAGETVLIPAFYFVAQGRLSAAMVISLSLLGTLLSDSIWFWLGKHHAHLHKLRPSYHEDFARFRSYIESLSEHPSRSLLYLKFLYGVRILTIVYLSAIRTPYWKFLVYNTIGSFFWILTFLIIVSLGSIGYLSVADSLPFLRIAAPAAIISAIALIKVSVWIRHSRG